MALLLRYRRDDGAIVGGWHSNDPRLVAAQQPPEDADYGYLLSEAEAPLLDALQLGWYVLAGALVEKQVCTLVATPSPFPADGVSVCTITVQPFVPCTLLIRGEAVVLTVADPTLELTSEVPEAFTLTVAPLAAYVVSPLTVEAA